MRIDLRSQQLEFRLHLFGFNLLEQKPLAETALNDFEGCGNQNNKKNENPVAVIVRYLDKNEYGEQGKQIDVKNNCRDEQSGVNPILLFVKKPFEDKKMKIYRKNPEQDNSQSGLGFHRECHAFFFGRYESDKKEKCPEGEVVGNSCSQDFLQETSL
jgi:hypothetical protein